MLFVDCVITNLQKIRFAKIVDFVPDAEIRAIGGLVMPI
jgi:hypothetical protein